jgi:putative PIN family toxin of toxin-antitoxin system
MLALRLVVDTNVLVSAALQRGGVERAAYVQAITKPARMYITEAILEEYAEVLARPRLGIPKGARLQFLDLIRNRGVLIAPRVRVQAAGDPDDNKFLECADAARADYLITGNRRHFPKFWKGTKIVTPREFLEMAAPHLLPG